LKKVATIQDISCVGKCSLTVALPLISAMGVECAIIPTAVLSTHTAFKEGWTFRDLTSDITPILDHWKREKFAFDALYSGYLGSFEQIELVKKMYADFGKNALKVVDPCMADNGKLYHGFTPEFALHMAKLCAHADIIVPNLTEASFMLNRPYKAAFSQSEVEEILRSLHKLGAKKVVLKGVSFEEGRLGIASFDGVNTRYYFHEKVAQSFHGTGDIFASVLVGALVREKSLEEAYKMAGNFVVSCIKETLRHSDHNTYGVDFESCIKEVVF